MKTHHLHKKYLGYIKTTSNPPFNYPEKLDRSLRKLDYIIGKDYHERDLIDEKIVGIDIKPENLSDIYSKYSGLIYYLCSYLNCIAFCKYTFFEGLSEPVRTVQVWGYYNDCKLASWYLKRLLDSLNHIREKKAHEYRKRKARLRISDPDKRLADVRIDTNNFIKRKANILSNRFRWLLHQRTDKTTNLVPDFIKRKTVIDEIIKFHNLGESFKSRGLKMVKNKIIGK